MDSKKCCVCACCGDRVGRSGRRSLNNKCLRLFLSARIYPRLIPVDGFICCKCRSMYSRWKSLPEVRHILSTVNFEDDRDMVTTYMVDVSGNATTDDESMMCDEHALTSDEETSDKESMDECVQSVDEFTGDNELVENGACLDEGNDEVIWPDNICDAVGSM
jgi:hypothetical protein